MSYGMSGGEMIGLTILVVIAGLIALAFPILVPIGIILLIATR